MPSENVHEIAFTDLPIEVLEVVLDYLNRESLLSLQNASTDCRHLVVSYIMNGRLGNRGMPCQRLEPSDAYLTHDRRTWDTITFKSSKPLLLVGFGVFCPEGGESMICVDARPIETNLRDLDCCTKLRGEIVKETINIFAKVPFVIERDVLWEVAMHISPTSKKYDPLKGKVVWAKVGKNGKQSVTFFGDTKIEFSSTQDRDTNWRTDPLEGQLPSLIFWPL